ncbi:MAG: hypothetical protein ABTD50_06750 [Polyangiaceae bacterium]
MSNRFVLSPSQLTSQTSDRASHACQITSQPCDRFPRARDRVPTVYDRVPTSTNRPCLAGERHVEAAGRDDSVLGGVCTLVNRVCTLANLVLSPAMSDGCTAMGFRTAAMHVFSAVTCLSHAWDGGLRMGPERSPLGGPASTAVRRRVARRVSSDGIDVYIEARERLEIGPAIGHGQDVQKTLCGAREPRTTKTGTGARAP